MQLPRLHRPLAAPLPPRQRIQRCPSPEEGPQILQQTGLAVRGGNAQLELDRVAAPSQEPLRIAEFAPVLMAERGLCAR